MLKDDTLFEPTRDKESVCENSVFLPEQVVAFSDQSCSDTPQSGMSNTRRTAKKSCVKESPTVFWTPLQSSETSESSSQKVTPLHIREWLMSCQPVSPVNPSVSQGSGQEQTTRAICGPQPSRPYALYDPASHSWKTCQGFLALDISEPSYETFTKAGTMHDGACSALTIAAPRTEGNDSGYWPTPHGFSQDGKDHGPSGNELGNAVNRSMWPTPTAHDDNKSPEAHLAMKKRMGERDGSFANRTAITNLQVMVKWRTPSASEADHGGPNARDSKGGAHLSSQVMWKTPTAEDSQNMEFARNNRGEPKLSAQVKVYPTPSTRDWKDTPGMAQEAFDKSGKFRNRIDQLARTVYANARGGKKTLPTPSASMVTMQDMEQARYAGNADRPKYADCPGGALNPDWVEWLMGVPIEFTALKPLEMARFQSWLQAHSAFLAKG